MNEYSFLDVNGEQVSVDSGGHAARISVGDDNYKSVYIPPAEVDAFCAAVRRAAGEAA